MADADPIFFAAIPSVVEREAATPEALDTLLRGCRSPFVIRGLVADWPMVQTGLRAPREVRQYLIERARDVPFAVSVGQPGHNGRMFYDAAMDMNFRTARGKLTDIFGGIDANEGRRDPPSVYLASIDVPTHFVGIEQENPLDLGSREPLVSLWIGTPTRIAAHNDFPDNLACCVAGARRFTLFPPEQFRNLYLGPIDNTPAGRAVSMVDFHAPDFDRYPRFADALAKAQLAELQPGDALFIPSMWWHHVEGLAPFNILLNYWWRDTPRYLGQPQDALNHAILAIRDLPAEDKAIWRDMFAHYVFESGPAVAAHIPENARGVLDPLTAETAGRLRAFLLRTLSR
ncbi:cupin-like domain-containing protein [Sphingomonas sp. SUN039]|uniref:cupin-like domain-containing protein n=1 Tax=Sphingomonas sp. SUN039 TaxID=2937787 RepID=UPI0021647DC3|nr:cupin-like domain-containing protein [Sphingomonas sp. SUN039]UVO53074.1 cupin-like domain-containing protein [Sphingomonas sp. SUN039]